ncbi:hypothetical protein TB1_042339 [Malus domestica]
MSMIKQIDHRRINAVIHSRRLRSRLLACRTTINRLLPCSSSFSKESAETHKIKTHRSLKSLRITCNNSSSRSRSCNTEDHHDFDHIQASLLLSVLRREIATWTAGCFAGFLADVVNFLRNEPALDPVLNNAPIIHDTVAANLNAKGTLDFLSGQTTSTDDSSSTTRKRNDARAISGRGIGRELESPNRIGLPAFDLLL